jgi:hypothetical protein
LDSVLLDTWADIHDSEVHTAALRRPQNSGIGAIRRDVLSGAAKTVRFDVGVRFSSISSVDVVGGQMMSTHRPHGELQVRGVVVAAVRL